jgi:threonine/homoserine/homoserine lactone efflux protein
MPSLSNLTAFLLIALVVIVIPGPSVVYTIGRALVLGRKAAILSVFGNAIGVGMQIVAVALGLGAVIAQSAELFFFVKVFGALFLIYLGFSAILHRNAKLDTAVMEHPPKAKRIILESIVVGITNAKTIVFFLAAFPQFVSPGSSPVTQILFMGLLFSIIGIASDSVWALAAGTARNWLTSSLGRLATVRAGGGVALMGLGAYMAYEAVRS